MERGRCSPTSCASSRRSTRDPRPTTFDAFRIVRSTGVCPKSTASRSPMPLRSGPRARGTDRGRVRTRTRPSAPCHNDLLADNFEADGFWLVDYEYSGMGDPFFDLGNLSINNRLSEASRAAAPADVRRADRRASRPPA